MISRLTRALTAAVLAVPLTSGAAYAADMPSCKAVQFPGPHGFLSVQTSDSGSVQWGGGMYVKSEEAGHYTIDVLVGGRRADRKHYLYFPHGSLPPGEARSGKIFKLQIDLVSDSGSLYMSVINGCRIP